MIQPRVLVIDDDYGDSEAIQKAFLREVDPAERCDFSFCSGQTDGRNSLQTVLAAVGDGWPPEPGRAWWSLVLLDVAFFQRPRPERGDAQWGFTVLEALRERWDDMPIVMLTGQRDAKSRANWTKADGFLEKPVEGAPGNDLAFLSRLYAFGLFPDLREKNRLAGCTLTHFKILQEARQFACDPLGSGRILYGETGTGKTELARFIHDEMALLVGRTGEFHAWSAAGSNQDLASSALFGHWHGAFSHADASEPGRIERAHGGTFFLDEVGSLSTDLQALFMESRRRHSVPEISPLLPRTSSAIGTAPGGDGRLLRLLTRMGKFPQHPKHAKQAHQSVTEGAILLRDHRVAIDVVMLTATNVNLHEEEVAETVGFRRDLLNDLGTAILVPALNDRREDIPLIFEEIVRRITRELNRPARQVHPDVTNALKHRDWTKKNIVALRQVAEHAVASSRDFDEILLRHLPAEEALPRWQGDRPPRPRTLVEIAGSVHTPFEARTGEPRVPIRGAVRGLAEVIAAFEVPTDRARLTGVLPELQEAYARLVLRLFGAALRATRNQRGETSSLKAVCELLGVQELKGSPQSQAAYDAVLRILDLANLHFEGLRGVTPPVLSDDPDVVERVEQAIDQRRKSSRKSTRG